MRLLPGPRPDVHVAVREVLALPAERPLAMGQRLDDQVDRLPEPVDDADGVGVAGGHLGAARLDEADLEPPAADDVGHRVLLGHPHRILADGDQSAEAQDADVPGLAREDAEDERAGAEEAVDAA